MRKENTTETVILGDGCSYTTDTKKSGLNNNIIVCGGSGSGKTMSISEPRLLGTVSSSLIATVTKKRLVYKYTGLFKSRGYEVLDLDLSKPERGNVGYDPLAYIKNPRDITFLASAIVKSDPRKGRGNFDPYWNDSAISLLSAEIAYILLTRKRATFNDVITMHEKLDVSEAVRGEMVRTAYDSRFEKLENRLKEYDGEEEMDPHKMLSAWKNIESGRTAVPEDASFDEKWQAALDLSRKKTVDTDLERLFDAVDKIEEGELLSQKESWTKDEADLARFALSCWNTFHGVPSKTASSIYGVLNTAIGHLFSREVRQLMRMKKADMERLSKRKTVLFVTTNPVNPSLGFIANMFYANVIKRLFEYAESLPSGVLPIPVHILCDDFATGGRIADFPEYISIFREKGISVTLLLQSESQLAAMYGRDNATTIINNCDTYVYMGGMDLTTARNAGLRLDAPYEDMLGMKVGDCVIFRRGERPVRTKRYNIEEDELYKKVTEEYESRIRTESERAAASDRHTVI